MPELKKCPLKLFRTIKCHIHAGARNPVWKQVAELEALLNRPTEDALRARIKVMEKQLAEVEGYPGNAVDMLKLRAENARLQKRVGELEQENRRLADLLSEKVEHLIVREAFSAKYGDHLIVTKGKVPYFKPTPAEEGKPEPPREEGRGE